MLARIRKNISVAMNDTHVAPVGSQEVPVLGCFIGQHNLKKQESQDHIHQSAYLAEKLQTHTHTQDFGRRAHIYSKRPLSNSKYAVSDTSRKVYCTVTGPICAQAIHRQTTCAVQTTHSSINNNRQQHRWLDILCHGTRMSTCRRTNE